MISCTILPSSIYKSSTSYERRTPDRIVERVRARAGDGWLGEGRALHRGRTAAGSEALWHRAGRRGRARALGIRRRGSIVLDGLGCVSLLELHKGMRRPFELRETFQPGSCGDAFGADAAPLPTESPDFGAATFCFAASTVPANRSGEISLPAHVRNKQDQERERGRPSHADHICEHQTTRPPMHRWKSQQDKQMDQHRAARQQAGYSSACSHEVSTRSREQMMCFEEQKHCQRTVAHNLSSERNLPEAASDDMDRMQGWARGSPDIPFELTRAAIEAVGLLKQGREAVIRADKLFESLLTQSTQRADQYMPSSSQTSLDAGASELQSGATRGTAMQTGDSLENCRVSRVGAPYSSMEDAQLRRMVANEGSEHADWASKAQRFDTQRSSSSLRMRWKKIVEHEKCDAAKSSRAMNSDSRGSEDDDAPSCLPPAELGPELNARGANNQTGKCGNNLSATQDEQGLGALKRKHPAAAAEVAADIAADGGHAGKRQHKSTAGTNAENHEQPSLGEDQSKYNLRDRRDAEVKWLESLHVGIDIDAREQRQHQSTQWFPARIVASKHDAVKVHYMGFKKSSDRWLQRDSKFLRRRTNNLSSTANLKRVQPHDAFAANTRNAAETFAVGDRVGVRFSQPPGIFHGSIDQCLPGSRFKVRFDDGEVWVVDSCTRDIQRSHRHCEGFLATGRDEEQTNAHCSSAEDSSAACPICTEAFHCMTMRTEIVKLDCGHVFCFGCITRWFSATGRKNTCPTCRRGFASLRRATRITAAELDEVNRESAASCDIVSSAKSPAGCVLSRHFTASEDAQLRQMEPNEHTDWVSLAARFDTKRSARGLRRRWEKLNSVADNSIGPSTEEHEVDKIIASRYNEDKKCIEYCIRWCGFDHREDTWEPIEHLSSNVADMAKNFRHTNIGLLPGNINTIDARTSSGYSSGKPYTHAEDAQLMRCVQLEGKGDWETKATKLGTARTGSALRKRWSKLAGSNPEVTPATAMS